LFYLWYQSLDKNIIMKYINQFIGRILLIIGCCFFTLGVKASHLYGGELFYTYISGNTYKITLILYGDCSGNPDAFGALNGATPEVKIYDGSFLYQTIYLNPESSRGIEVTPVCASSLGSTTCNGGSVPGVMKFVYSYNVELYTSSDWQIYSTDRISVSTQAGRSAAITNIFSGGGSSLMTLRATLNNLSQPNSNPTYTTIPTPFFCINVPQEYNQGAVDPNGDSLVYELVPGFEGTTVPRFTVAYQPGFSGAAPLATAPGTFSFSKSSGQLTFTPNMAQTSMVVGLVSEYRKGVLVGTSMREMNFIVLSTCSNKSPTAKLIEDTSKVSKAKISGNAISICKDAGKVIFDLIGNDDDGDNIAITYSGLPSGAIVRIRDDKTKSPKLNFEWDITGKGTGSYNFFITYQDEGCPLSSKQTVAYTINIVDKPTVTIKKVSDITCVRSELFDIEINHEFFPWVYNIYKGSALIKTITSNTKVSRDSLTEGIYTFKFMDGLGCENEFTYSIAPPKQPIIDSLNFKQPKCFGDSSGFVQLYAGGSKAPYSYQLIGGETNTTGLFNDMWAGRHRFRITDANGCFVDTAIFFHDTKEMTLSYTTKIPFCRPYTDGAVTFVAGDGMEPYLYDFEHSGSFSTENHYTDLMSGIYNVLVVDANGCKKDFKVEVKDSVTLKAVYDLKHQLCNGDSMGKIKVRPFIGYTPFVYSFDGSAFNSIDSFTNLKAGEYAVIFKDIKGCIKDTTIKIQEPDTFSLTIETTDLKCNQIPTGEVKVTHIEGNNFDPIRPYQFSINGSAKAPVTSFNSLNAGTHILTVYDVKGCQKDYQVSLDEPDSMSLIATTRWASCDNANDGTLLIEASGGTPGYLYSLNGGISTTSNFFTNLKGDGYGITVTDANGCKKDTTIIVSKPAAIRFDSVRITNPTCEGYTDGAAEIFLSGGTPPYQYANVFGIYGTVNVVSSLSAGIYTLRVRDDNGCIVTNDITLKGYTPIDAQIVDIVSPSCYGFQNGEFKVNVTEGNAPFRLVRNGTTDTITHNHFGGLYKGDYSVVVVDSKNCSKAFPLHISEPDSLGGAVLSTGNDCTGALTGALTADIVGGKPPYYFSWSTGANGIPQISQLPNGSYSLKVSDNNGCVKYYDAFVDFDNCCKPGIPNAFTPNGDGINDAFKLNYKGGIALKEMSIYNRYGQQVFTTNNKDEGWDGRFKGQDEGLGVYYYYIKVVCGNNHDQEVEFKGDLTLIR
jgi:gliding motility-associated-like protein